MDLPPAIREDHNPLAFEGPLAFLRWTTYSCPHCQGVFRRDFWPYNVRLGSGERMSKKCGKVFDDGSREWPDLAASRKLRYFLPPGIQALTGAGLFCVIFTLIIAPRDVVNFQTGSILVAVFLSPVLVWCLLRLPFVLRSVHRFKDEHGVHQRISG